MGYVLLTILFVELITFYWFNGKNVVSPSFLGCAVFILSTVVYLSAGDYYQYALHGGTVAAITGLLFCIFLGELAANHIKVKEKEQISQEPILTSVSVCVLMALVVLALSMIRFFEIYRFSLLVGNKPGNFWGMAEYVREAKLNETRKYNPSIFSSQGFVISMCALFFAVYSICANKNYRGKLYARYIPIILAYLPQVFASDDRTGFLRTLTICTIIVFFFVKQKNGWTKKGNIKIIFSGMVVICLFLICFRWLGYRTGTSMRNEVWDNITEYTSAGLVGLDKYLQKGEPANELVGQGTLKNIYNILRQWGLPIPQVAPFEAVFSYARGESNVYTTFKAYMKDYSMVGAMFAMFLWGLIITYSIKHIRKNGAGFVRLCLVSMMFYPVMMLSIEDVTASMLSITTVYTTVYLVLLDWFFVRRTIRVRI